MPSRREPDIRAAGAVVWRVHDRDVQVAVVHRPHYDDWSLPKGKLDRGERSVLAAVREVGEEIGSRVAVTRRLPAVRYEVGSSVKEVGYWLARHVDGDFAANHEVDDVVWLPPAEARERVGYPGDRRVLDEALRLPLPEATVVLVRHARAGKRSAWTGEDCERPLDAKGRGQADALVAFLSAFAPDRVVSAEPVRCRQSVEPFAEQAGLAVEIDVSFGDATAEADPAATHRALAALARPGHRTVVSSQGKAIPALLHHVWPRHRLPDTKKGNAWVLSFADGELLAADHYGDAARLPKHG